MWWTHTHMHAHTTDATHVQFNGNTPSVIYTGFTYRWPPLESKQCVFGNDGNKPSSFPAWLSILSNSGSTAAAVYPKLIRFALKCFPLSGTVCIFLHLHAREAPSECCCPLKQRHVSPSESCSHTIPTSFKNFVCHIAQEKLPSHRQTLVVWM